MKTGEKESITSAENFTESYMSNTIPETKENIKKSFSLYLPWSLNLFCIASTDSFLHMLIQRTIFFEIFATSSKLQININNYTSFFYRGEEV